ncbi:MAG: hypothetical protein E5Y62_01830 [Mesorhizobium sp.]|nr:MAG: hypothetical protein E5Y62_01830 [Mesorhizobium sp.]
MAYNAGARDGLHCIRKADQFVTHAMILLLSRRWTSHLCERCGKHEFMHVETQIPTARERQGIRVRRLAERFESCRVQHCRSSLADNYSCWN